MATGFSTRSGSDGYRLNFDTDNLDYYLLMQKIARHCVDGKPASDVAPVRHGRWLTTDAYPHHLYCSVCYNTYAKNAKWVNELDLPTKYCPNCGALMREIKNGEK